jgi:hypothetical protein
MSAPTAAAVAFYLLWLAWLLFFVAPSPRQSGMYWDLATKLPQTWPIIVYAFVCALLVEVLVGLPLLALFRRMGWLSFRGFLVGGCIAAVVFYFVVRGLEPPVDAAVALVLLLIPGGVGAIVFGYVGGWLTGRLSGPA